MLLYLLARNILFDVGIFFVDWYVKGSHAIWAWIGSVLQDLERLFAVRLMIRYWVVPLYQDYSVIGYVVGVPFRTVRILIGLAVYLCVFAVGAFVWLIWLSIPLVALAGLLSGYASRS